MPLLIARYATSFQYGDPVLQPVGVEVTAEQGTPVLIPIVLPVGQEVMGQVGTPSISSVSNGTFASLTSQFPGSSLPATLQVGTLDPGGSITVAGGTCTIVAPTLNGTKTASVISVGTYSLDTAGCYIRQTCPAGQEPYGAGFVVFDAANNGYGISTSSTSTTPNSATTRANRYVSGVVTHVQQVAFDSTNHRWRRVRLSGDTLFWDVAPDNGTGTGPGTWTNLASESIATHNPSWDPTTSFASFGANTEATGQNGKTFVYDGLNTTTS